MPLLARAGFLAALLLAMSTATAQDDPLPPCPETPNCHRATLALPLPPEDALRLAESELRNLRGLSIGRATEVERVGSDHLRATFRVVVFTDDVDVAVRPSEAGSVLHVRSASRVGHSDLGVNRRRVEAFLEAVRSRL